MDNLFEKIKVTKYKPTLLDMNGLGWNVKTWRTNYDKVVAIVKKENMDDVLKELFLHLGFSRNDSFEYIYRKTVVTKSNYKRVIFDSKKANRWCILIEHTQDLNFIERVVRTHIGGKVSHVVSFYGINRYWKSEIEFKKLTKFINDITGKNGHFAYIEFNGDNINPTFKLKENLYDSVSIENKLIYQRMEHGVKFNLDNFPSCPYSNDVVLESHLDDLLTMKDFIPRLHHRCDGQLFINQEVYLLSALFNFGLMTKTKLQPKVLEIKPIDMTELEKFRKKHNQKLENKPQINTQVDENTREDVLNVFGENVDEDISDIVENFNIDSEDEEYLFDLSNIDEKDVSISKSTILGVDDIEKELFGDDDEEEILVSESEIPEEDIEKKLFGDDDEEEILVSESETLEEDEDIKKVFGDEDDEEKILVSESETPEDIEKELFGDEDDEEEILVSESETPEDIEKKLFGDEDDEEEILVSESETPEDIEKELFGDEEGEDVEKELFGDDEISVSENQTDENKKLDEETVFQIFSRSANKPPGKGTGEKIKNPKLFTELGKIKDWRRILYRVETEGLSKDSKLERKIIELTRNATIVVYNRGKPPTMANNIIKIRSEK
jgi:hypothetical protein